MADFHIELIEEILLGLPFKSLARRLCVSNLWIRRIESPIFSKMHLNKALDADTDRAVLLSNVGSKPTDQFHILAFDDDNDEIITKTFTSEVRIYTSRSDVWRRIRALPAIYSTFEVARGSSEDKTIKCVFLNGHFHWLMEDIQDFSWKILAFDIESEEFSDFELPADLEPNNAIRLETLGGHLYLIDHRDDRVNVWRIDDYENKESWVCLYALGNDPERIHKLFFPTPFKDWPIYFESIVFRSYKPVLVQPQNGANAAGA